MLANKNRNGDLQHKTQCHCRTIGIGLNVLRTTSQLWVFLGIFFSQQKLNDFDTIIMCLHKSLEVCNHPCSIAVIFMHHFDGQAKTLSLSAGQSYFGQGSAQACRCPWLAFLSLGWIGMSQLGWWNQIQELPCFVTTKDYKGRRWGINVKDEDEEVEDHDVNWWWNWCGYGFQRPTYFAAFRKVQKGFRHILGRSSLPTSV